MPFNGGSLFFLVDNWSRLKRPKAYQNSAWRSKHSTKPSKPFKNIQKKSKNNERIWFTPQSSICFQTYPNASEKVQAGPSKSQSSKNLQKLRKTLEIREELEEKLQRLDEYNLRQSDILWEECEITTLNAILEGGYEFGTQRKELLGTWAFAWAGPGNRLLTAVPNRPG